MRTLIRVSSLAFVGTCLLASASAAADLTVTFGETGAHGVIADRYAFCPPAGTKGADISPAVTWSAGPSGTRSYALRMQDLDVPASFDQIEKPGVTIPSDAPRISVDHWVLADIPVQIHALAEGADSAGFVKGGKPTGPTSHGVRGTNIYARFLAAKPGMAGPYGGYDGPCPPRNDQRPHRYVVEVFALNIGSLTLPIGFTGAEMAKAMAGHILAQGQASAVYSRWKTKM
ncbi:YbhB/YbcL family Raf kinase inhibitor-like protein [Acidisoma cellulosilytica]|uniref:YbhB/YbcL family Raf kinase inhibitor-like protein n=1 Tax=Acidisoma cellulosilyticum TaxID=2802395 RepID=A0A963YYU3_9PROT|nr:YbhB/YbcL family Raf kinase inhibitor-like protein [Acidisoma cellulosilyticum]MCB8879339.1 YbhB/YbcL family Raf kinase inhibitor-like protein [Acidisoma cellulosilyticum]